MRDLIGACMLVLLFIAIAGALVIIALDDSAKNERERRECLDRGGSIVPLHRDGAWFCEELRPRR